MKKINGKLFELNKEMNKEEDKFIDLLKM